MTIAREKYKISLLSMQKGRIHPPPYKIGLTYLPNLRLIFIFFFSRSEKKKYFEKIFNFFFWGQVKLNFGTLCVWSNMIEFLISEVDKYIFSFPTAKKKILKKIFFFSDGEKKILFFTYLPTSQTLFFNLECYTEKKNTPLLVHGN